MKIKKLILKSFGKFNNKTIELSDGMNIIYGKNEAGKTTIHTFIQGMFYGFYKQNMKTKRNTDEYDLYLPWNNPNNYSGALIIEDDGEVRIERNFLKRSDLVEAFNNITGENVSNQYEYDTVTKLIQPGLKHLGINQNTYNNTINITQMGNKTSDELVNEIKDSIINIGETNSVEVSVNRVMKKVQEKKMAIGTLRSKKSPLAIINSKIKDLKKEKEAAIIEWEEINELRQKEQMLSDALESLEKKKKKLSKIIKYKRYKKNEDIKKQILEVQKDIKDIDDKLNNMKIYLKVSKEDINQALTEYKSIELLKKEKEHQKQKIDEIQNKITETKNMIKEISLNEEQIGSSEKISKDVYKYEELENAKNTLISSFNSADLIEAEQEASHLKILKRKTKIFMILMLVLSIITGIITATKMIDSINFNFIFIPLLIITFISLITYFIQSKREKKNNIIIEKEKKEEENIQIRKKWLEENLETILKEYNCQDIQQLKELRDEKKKEEILKEEYGKKIEQLEKTLNYYNELLDKEDEAYQITTEKLDIKEDYLDNFMKEVNAHSEKELQLLLDGYYEFLRLKQEKRNKEDIVDQLSKGLKKDEEAVEIANIDTKYNEKENEELENDLKKYNDSIVSISKEISALSSTIVSKENKVRKVTDIDAEINELQKEHKHMKFKLRSFELIEEAVGQISKSIQNNFAPMLNKKISDIVSVATDYKYTEVKVNTKMELSVVDNSINKLVKVEKLSAGTIDLMYFALRIGIAEVISGNKKLPIILDDCFVQYDERRLMKTLEVLSKFNRQIILLTCHEREKKLVSKIMPNVNEVLL